MMNTTVTKKGCLQGKTIFLSASIPNPERNPQYLRVKDAHIKVEEAVISLARAIFVEDGRLVFGGHPTISPLIAMVAGEYLTPQVAESHDTHFGNEKEKNHESVLIYQSEAFREHTPYATLQLFQLGFASIRWIGTVDDERFDPSGSSPPCPKSMKSMRKRMLEETNPASMICIGGMEGVEEELEMFLEICKGKPVYTLAETGGAAAIIAKKSQNQKYDKYNKLIRTIDQEIINSLKKQQSQMKKEYEDIESPSLDHPDFFSELNGKDFSEFIPFPLIMQNIVKEISGNSHSSPSEFTQ